MNETVWLELNGLALFRVVKSCCKCKANCNRLPIANDKYHSQAANDPAYKSYIMKKITQYAYNLCKCHIYTYQHSIQWKIHQSQYHAITEMWKVKFTETNSKVYSTERNAAMSIHQPPCASNGESWASAKKPLVSQPALACTILLPSTRHAIHQVRKREGTQRVTVRAKGGMYTSLHVQLKILMVHKAYGHLYSTPPHCSNRLSMPLAVTRADNLSICPFLCQLLSLYIVL